MTLNLDKCEFSIQNMKFNSSKDCELALSRAVRLRYMRISEDHAKVTGTAQKTLLSFAKARNQKFKLRHDKLFMNGKGYIRGKHANSVIER